MSSMRDRLFDEYREVGKQRKKIQKFDSKTHNLHDTTNTYELYFFGPKIAVKYLNKVFPKNELYISNDERRIETICICVECISHKHISVYISTTYFRYIFSDED